MEGASVDNKHKIVVAVDESEESMDALSWCLSNIISHNSHHQSSIKPPPIIYSSLDISVSITFLLFYITSCVLANQNPY
uniref:UspA domain-containing protein n=1 Tax=Salix viminalis TaxID=40686 RepID=A0A6N2N1W0_SALVM